MLLESERSRIPRSHARAGQNQNGPNQTRCGQALANTAQHERCTAVHWLCKLLLKVHQRLHQSSLTTTRSCRSKQGMEMGGKTANSIQHPKEAVYGTTAPSGTRHRQEVPNRI